MKEHEDITVELIQLNEHNPDLKELLEKSIAQAGKLNPDPDTNPVRDLEGYYAFIDRNYRLMPWRISPSKDFDSLYERIDQGMGCLYFVCCQPLDELKGRGYYHNSLIYHEPFRSWFIRFLSVSGEFLSTEDSWKDRYYQKVLANPDFHLDDDTYESPENWKTFNDFFARRLKDPSRRPMDSPDDCSVIVSPADSVPQGIWEIGSDSKVIAHGQTEQAGLRIKTGTLRDVSVLLGNSAYAKAFAGGRMTHTFLDINDYHRYHFPAGGRILESFVISQDSAPGGVITWVPEENRYREFFTEVFGWQSIETRGVLVMEAEGGGLMAVVPVGMCQVASVNFENNAAAGMTVKKGDPLGWFMFGGSDIVMLFSEDMHFEMTAEAGKHILTGKEYGRTGGNRK